MRIQVQAFYYKTWSIQAGSGSSKQVWHGQDTRVVLRQAWVGDRRTVSKGLDRRGNPGTKAIIQNRGNKVQRARLRVNPENTGRNQTREDNLGILGKRFVCHKAKQYSAVSGRKSRVYVVCVCDWVMVNRCKRDHCEQLCGCSE